MICNVTQKRDLGKPWVSETIGWFVTWLHTYTSGLTRPDTLIQSRCLPTIILPKLWNESKVIHSWATFINFSYNYSCLFRWYSYKLLPISWSFHRETWLFYVKIFTIHCPQLISGQSDFKGSVFVFCVWEPGGSHMAPTWLPSKTFM